MWIKNRNNATKKMKVNGEIVEFTDNGTAQVTKNFGEYLINNYPSISSLETDTEEEDTTQEEGDY